MNSMTEKPQPPSQMPKRIEAKFTKSNHYRVIHADGAWGGISPDGYIRMALYNQSAPVPGSVTYEVKEHGLLEVEREASRDTLIRELEVDVVMNIPVARSLRDWLSDKITQFEQAPQKLRERGAGGSGNQQLGG